MALRCSPGALRPEPEGVAGLRGDYFDLGRGSLDGTAASEFQSRDGSRGVGGWQEAGSGWTGGLAGRVRRKRSGRRAKETKREVVELAGKRASEAGSSRSRRSQSGRLLLVSLHGVRQARLSQIPQSQTRLDPHLHLPNLSHIHTHIYQQWHPPRRKDESSDRL